MDYVHELEGLVQAMARSLEEVRGPFGDHFRQLIRGVHEVTRKLETRLVKEAAIHRQATFADGELKGSASDGAVAPPEQHRDEVAELDNQPTGGDVTVTSQYRPAGMSDSDSNPSDDEEWDALYPPGEHYSDSDCDDDCWFLEEWSHRH
jgi:hypothetical protein